MPRNLFISPGDIFGRLRVIEQVEDKIYSDGSHRSQFLCECNCGCHSTVVVTGTALKSGVVQSCGCLKKDKARKMGNSNRVLGLSTSKIGKVYYNMKVRAAQEPGGEKANICQEWAEKNGLKSFNDVMGSSYIDGARLGRADPSQAFSPENCYWKISKAMEKKTGFKNAISYDY